MRQDFSKTLVVIASQVPQPTIINQRHQRHQRHRHDAQVNDDDDQARQPGVPSAHPDCLPLQRPAHGHEQLAWRVPHHQDDNDPDDDGDGDHDNYFENVGISMLFYWLLPFGFQTPVWGWSGWLVSHW